MSQVSRYQATWEHIKARGFVRLRAEPKYHKRIVKALRKRKDLDLAFKYECEEVGKRYRLCCTVLQADSSIIEFTLQRTIGIRDL